MNEHILNAVRNLCKEVPRTSAFQLNNEYIRLHAPASNGRVKILIHDDGDCRVWIGYQAGQGSREVIAPSQTELYTAFDLLKKHLLSLRPSLIPSPVDGFQLGQEEHDKEAHMAKLIDDNRLLTNALRSALKRIGCGLCDEVATCPACLDAWEKGAALLKSLAGA